MEQLNTRIVLRNDSHENWEANPGEVLLKGETGIEFFSDGSVKVKIGDGVTAWRDLGYFAGSSGNGGTIALGDGKSIIVTDGTVGLMGFASATAGQVPRVGVDGNLEWYTPLTTDNAAELTEQVNGLATTVGENTAAIEAMQTGKANAADVYTKAEVDTLVNNTVIKDVVGTKEELATIENPQAGDRVQVLGDQIYVYNGTEWEPYSLTTIDVVSINGTALEIVNKTVDIPVATADALGVVKGSNAPNGVIIKEDGSMEVSSISADKINQTEGTVLVLNGGSSSTVTA